MRVIFNMEDEEDVIFDNSPLYKHLSEVGFTDFHAESLNDHDESRDLNINENLRESNNENIRYRDLKERDVNSLKRFIFSYVLPSSMSEELSCYNSSVARIHLSGLLTEDDLELLYRYEQCIDVEFNPDNIVIGNIVPEKGKSEETITTKNTETRLSFLFDSATGTFITGIILLTAIILGLSSETNSTYLKYFSCIVLSIVFVWLLLQLHVSQRSKILFKKNMVILQDYIEFTEKFLVLIRKVILFIQEKELITRGHIIVNPEAPVTRLESQIKQCIMLRKCLFIEMGNYLGLLHGKIRDVSDLNCIGYGNFSWLQKELIRIWNECSETDNNLLENGHSLSELKKIFGTLGRRQSSLLCCVAVYLMSVIIKLQKTGRRSSDMCRLYSSLVNLLNEGKQCYDKLNECYKFHKVDIPALTFEQNQQQLSSENTTYLFLGMAVRSMTLHLQLACRTSIEIEENIDRLVKESTGPQTSEDLHQINKQILMIGHEIEKLHVCYEESQNRLQELVFSESTEKIGNQTVKETENGGSTEQENKNVQILNFVEVEPVPDQIFEGETTSERGSEIQSWGNLGREELLREEKMRQEGQRLLKELKSVLATKDEEKMVSIPKVLLKKFAVVKMESELENSVKSEGIQSSEVDVFNSVPGSKLQSFQSEVKSTCNEKMESLEPFDDGIIKEEAIKMMPVVDDLLEDQKQAIPESHNAESLRNKNSDVVHYELHEERANDYVRQTNHSNPFASMVAAAAAARNRQFGLKEQSYEIEAEIRSNESDTD